MAKKQNERPPDTKPRTFASGVPVYCAYDEIVPIGELRPNPKNPNKHPQDQLEKLGKIIRGNGWRNPITVSTRSGLIVKGHGRMMAAELEEFKEVPVEFQNYESDEAELADLTADNRIAELAEVDTRMLTEIFADIDTGAIDFELSGYTEKEYKALEAAFSEVTNDSLHEPDDVPEPDDATQNDNVQEQDYVPEPPSEPVTKYGDVWILGGRHRVMCGSCTNADDKAKLLNGEKPQILLTDPPYCSGGSKESDKSIGSIGTVRKDGNQPMIANDILSTRGYQNLISAALADTPCLFAYIFTDWRMWVYLFDLAESAGFGCNSMIVWNKKTPGMGIGWRSQHELCLFGSRGKTHFDKHKGYGNVLEISRSGNELHPTQKPVELIEAIVDNTDFAEGVYDPFGGSGTTMMAADAKNQKSYIMEISPAFVDVIVKRYIRANGSTDVKCIRNGVELPRKAIADIFNE